MTKGSDYVELHARSAFSFHRGASDPESLAARAADLDLSAVAVCDRDGVYGAPRMFRAGKETGIRSLVGAEVTLEDQSVLPLLVESQKGYQNLCRMLTDAKLSAAKGESRVTWRHLEEFKEGLICLTGDEEGAIHQAVAHRQHSLADTRLKKLLQLFGRNHVYVELQRHQNRESRRISNSLADLAEQYRLPILATNGVQYAQPKNRALLDVFTCLRNHTHLDAAGDLLSINHERHLKSGEDMAQLFRDRPEAIRNTITLAERLEFTLANLGYAFPDFPTRPGESMAGRLRDETFRGARSRYGNVDEKVRKQLNHELEIINNLGFAGYFLIVWELCNFAREQDILVQGRGSAANSAVCYSLGITAVDPIECKLLFERFLSEGRETWPDIDLDLPSGDKREAVIQEVYRRFGPRGAAMTANVISYRGRSAVREIGKTLNLPTSVMDRFSSLYQSGDFPQTIELENQLKESGLPDSHPRFQPLVKLYQQIYGLPRHLGQHCGGMIIGNHGLDSVVPLEPASMPNRVIVQWDKDDCEDLGIIKIDLLGLGMMAVIEDSFRLCSERGGSRAAEFDKIPYSDEDTYKMIQKADTVGVFQIESRAQMATLPRMKPVTFYDLAIEVAIIRPGPIAGNLTHPYLDRRSGKKPVTYMHPDLKPVLERTLGVPLFQEQVLKIAMILADFSGSEAEELRRAMSFNRSNKRMQKAVHNLKGALDAKQVEESVQNQLIEAIQSFALYGFPESHAISFARLAYVSAWLKCHRGVEFYTSLLNNQPMGFYSPDSLIKDANRHGIRVRPVDVMHSNWHSTIENDTTFRLGLQTVNGLSSKAAADILQSRQKGPWKTIQEFVGKTGIQKDERRRLAEVGALNSLSQDRRDALWQVESPRSEDDLFDNSNGPTEPSPRILSPMTASERIEADYDGLGLTTGPHPMAYLRDQLPDAWRASDLPQATAGATIQIAGVVICRQRPGTAKGNLFISLEDETGIANAFVPKAVFEDNRLILTQEKLLIIEGKVQNAQNVITVLAQRFEALTAHQLKAKLSHDFH